MVTDRQGNMERSDKVYELKDNNTVILWCLAASGVIGSSMWPWE